MYACVCLYIEWKKKEIKKKHGEKTIICGNFPSLQLNSFYFFYSHSDFTICVIEDDCK